MLRVLRYKHDHILSGHPGQNKTIDLIRCDYTWPGLHEFVKKYVQLCTTCMRAKPKRHKPYGLLKQLLIHEHPWDSISMDFIETLPNSNSYNSILVIVDHLMKQGIHPNNHQLYVRGPCLIVHPTCVLQTWYS
jgi:hypothetical protein